MASPLSILILSVCFCISVNCDDRQNDHAKDIVEKYIADNKGNIDPRYRQIYHVTAPIGWINDPNGFSFYKGKYHLFYQYYPFDSKWGPMHWGHFSSENLVDWNYMPTALLPDEEYCFSGSAAIEDNKMTLMYTGHIVNESDSSYNQSQYIAISEDGVNFEKYPNNPVLESSPFGSPDFRDPKVWKHNDHWYVIIGSKTSDNRGNVVLYRSLDLIEWDFLSVVGESTGNMGYMWECPDFFELNGKYILLISPQGMSPVGDRYHNLYQTGYIVGNFDYETFKFEPTSEFQELDYGHDFYAATTTEANGRRLLVGWLGMWEENFQEAADGWAGTMTIIRELQLTPQDKLIMKPVQEMVQLRTRESWTGIMKPRDRYPYNKPVEIQIRGKRDENIQLLLKNSEGNTSLKIQWDSDAKKIIINRDGNIRRVEWDAPSEIVVNIYMDTSSVELFWGDGEAVFSSRVYPIGGWILENEGTQTHWVRSYELRRSISF